LACTRVSCHFWNHLFLASHFTKPWTPPVSHLKKDFNLWQRLPFQACLRIGYGFRLQDFQPRT
jgi:hypothetical protein